MINARAEAFAPASMGNVGCGFDILGLAFEEPGDTVIVEPRDEPGAVIAAIEGDGGRLPRDAAKNSAAVAANSVLRLLGARQGVNITLHKNLPLASGLGSSAASAVAAAVAVDALYGMPLTLPQLLPACLDGEAAVSGYHPDNVGPSLLGGITLITGTSINEIRRLPVPDNLHCALVTPCIAVPTSQARAVLPEMVPLTRLVAQTGAVARLVDALHRGDLETMAAAMEGDRIIEPARAHSCRCWPRCERQPNAPARWRWSSAARGRRCAPCATPRRRPNAWRRRWACCTTRRASATCRATRASRWTARASSP